MIWIEPAQRNQKLIIIYLFIIYYEGFTALTRKVRKVRDDEQDMNVC